MVCTIPLKHGASAGVYARARKRVRASLRVYVCVCVGFAMVWLGSSQDAPQEMSSGQASSVETCVGQKQPPVSLLQLKTDVQSAAQRDAPHGRPLPLGADLIPAMRTLVSTDPKGSAAFMTKYLRAKALPAPTCQHAEVAMVEVDLGSGSTAVYGFIKDPTKPAGNWTPDVLMPAVDQFWQESQKLNEWLDNHDAFPLEVFYWDKALSDNLTIAVNDDDMIGIDGLPSPVVRVWIPYTLWSVEFTGRGHDGSEKQGLIVAECRDLGRSLDYIETWKKATFMTSDPAAAARFAMDVLGAEHLESPYPWPPQPGCYSAQWVVFPESGFQFHFPHGDSVPPLHPNAEEFVKSVEQVRNISSGAFDVWMYNSLIFRVASLDPWVLRFQSKGVPFVVVRIDSDEGSYALIADIPGTGSVVQLRSSSVSVVAPLLPEVCLLGCPQ